MGGAHHLADVRAHPLTHEQVLPQNLVHLVAERPDFVALTACQLAHVADVLLLALIPRAALAVHPEDRAEARPLEPAHQQLAERRVIHLTAEEAANVARPPRNACHAHAQTRLQLLPHRAEGGGNVARPSENGVFLAARPCAAHKRQNLRFARFAQSIVEALCVADGVGVCALQGRAGVIAVVVKVIRPVFRLGLVQPEAADAILVVVLLALLPDECLRFRVRRVEEERVAHPRHDNRVAAVSRHQQAALCHFAEVDALFVDGRPDGYNRLHAHCFQFVHHRLRIRPVPRLKAEITLPRPVEEVDDDGIQRQPAALHFARDRQQFLLRPVAQLALPVAHAVFGHHRGAPGCGGVVRFDVRRGVARRDEIIQLFGGFCRPLRDIRAERRRADCRIVPQEAVAAAGHEERHA